MANLYDLSTGTGFTGQTVSRFQALRIGRLGYTGNRGTAALPAIAFEEDTTTGIYSAAASSLDFTTAGVRAVSVTSGQGLTMQGAGALTLGSGGIAGAGNAAANVLLGVAGDFTVWYPAVSFPAINYTTGTWTATRVAAGDYTMVHTASAQTSTLEFSLYSDLQRITASRGYKVTGLKDIEQVTTAALTSNTPLVLQVVYANNTADTVTSTTIFGTITGTAPTATQANPYVTTYTFGTPIFFADLTGFYWQKVLVLAATTAYSYMGFFLQGTVVV